MNIKNRFISGIILSLVCGIFVAGPANAAQDEDEERSSKQKTKQAQAVSKEVYDRIEKAQVLIDEEDDQGALKILNALLNKKNITEYEQQNVLNYIGFVNYNLENIPQAIDAYERMLKIPSLEEQVRKQTVYTLAQLMTMEEKYAKAITLLDQWFVLETNPASDPYILYAQNLYQINRYADMVKPIESAIAVAKKRDLPAKEDWYVLLNFAYFQQEDYKMVRDIQKILLVNWPKKRYWFSLAGAYTELGEDNNLMGAYDAAHTQGLLESESELLTMAQLFMQHEVPYKAGMLIEKEMASGRVAKNAKNYRLLSQAWTLASEDEKSVPALQAAARLSDEGELNLRLGNAHLNLGQYDECVIAIKEGIRKGGIKSPDNAQISLGMCLYNQKKYGAAKTAFNEAGKTARSRKMSQQWVSVINSDLARNKQIQLAEAAAQKQQKELASRRRASDRSL
jgi:tetratricopeptide (TPR) repeat protein